MKKITPLFFLLAIVLVIGLEKNKTQPVFQEVSDQKQSQIYRITFQDNKISNRNLGKYLKTSRIHQLSVSLPSEYLSKIKHATYQVKSNLSLAENLKRYQALLATELKQAGFSKMSEKIGLVGYPISEIVVEMLEQDFVNWKNNYPSMILEYSVVE